MQSHNRSRPPSAPDQPRRASHYASSAPERIKHEDKILQVIQNLFKRTALIIVSSRVTLAPILESDTNTPRTSTWFQLKLNESDELNDKIERWRHADIALDRPQPLVIEIYLDIGELTRNQTLVLVDERGKKWDVGEALQPPRTTAAGRARRERDLKVILERWTVHLDEPSPSRGTEASEAMANVYKKASISMHSLLAYANLLPAFKFARRTMQETATLTALRPQYRVASGRQAALARDSLTTSLYPSGEPTCETYKFWPIQTPAGRFNTEVVYRKNCNFQVSNYEELVSAHFIGMEDDRLPDSDLSNRDMPYNAAGREIGSLPAERRWPRDTREANQAYGSLGTFHHAGHTGTSPISALRQARDMQSPTEESMPQKIPPNHRTSQSSKSSLKSNEAPPPNVRRPSVSFQPFREGSLSSSPASAGLIGPSPSSSYTRGSDLSKGLAQARNIRPSPTLGPEFAVGSPSSGASPKAPPLTRYSSSFGHRRTRLSSGGTSNSKEEENNSSGSSSKRESATLPGEPGGGSGSSGSVQTDDDSIGNLIRMLDQKKDLKSLHRTDEAAKDASSKRTASALSRYRGMRESNAQLSESLSSSVMVHRSSGSSSQRLSAGVPPTLAGTSVSSSSSPGNKPVSPHTPAVPSRLSEETRLRAESRHREQAASESSSSSSNDEASDTTPNSNIRGIPIPPPTSPSSRGVTSVRRSSSARPRPGLGIGQFAARPSSVPLSNLPQNEELALHDVFHDTEAQPQIDAEADDQPSAGSPRETFPHRQYLGSGARQSPTSELGRSGSNRHIPPSEGSRPRLAHSRGSGSTSSGGRFSFQPQRGSTQEDEEPLLFTMNDMSRQSLEELNVKAKGRSKDGR